MYDPIKTIHIGAVILSFSLFFTRGLWMIAESPRLNHRWVRIVPHVIDTILLISAIALSVLIAQYPFVQGWLTAKVVLLVIYIGLGMIALRRGKTKSIRVGTWVAALLVFVAMVLIAIHKTPNPLSFV